MIAPAHLASLRPWAEAVGKAARTDPARYVRLTAPQEQWLRVRSRLALLRGGNQIGKSTVQAVDLWRFIRQEHPVQTHRGRLNIAVGVYSWAQGDSFIRRIWELRRPGEVDPRIRYEPKQGLRGMVHPVLPIVSGPGAGTIVSFFTYMQGTERIAGETLHRVYLDEPPPQTIFGEVLPRLNVLDGHLRMSYTPTPESPPQDWAKGMVEKWRAAGCPDPAGDGQLHEVHVPLTVEACTPLGGLVPVPFMTGEKIAAFVASLAPDERAMRVEGAWEVALVGQWLEHYSAAASMLDFAIDTGGRGGIGGRVRAGPPPGARVAVGIDHGGGPGKQAASLIAFWPGADPGRPDAGHAADPAAPDASPVPYVWVLDARKQAGYSTVEQDARMILDMLGGWGLTVQDVDLWIGDRSSEAGSQAVAKSNGDLRKELQRLAGVSGSAFWIKTPVKFGGSVRRGYQLLNGIMEARWPGLPGRSRFVVHPKAERLSKAAQTFRGGKNEEPKDILDAVRYPVEQLVREMSAGSAGAAASAVIAYHHR